MYGLVCNVFLVSLLVFQLYSLVRAAEAASSRASATTAAAPAVPHLTELHSCNDAQSTTYSHLHFHNVSLLIGSPTFNTLVIYSIYISVATSDLHTTQGDKTECKYP